MESDNQSKPADPILEWHCRDVRCTVCILARLLEICADVSNGPVDLSMLSMDCGRIIRSMQQRHFVSET